MTLEQEIIRICSPLSMLFDISMDNDEKAIAYASILEKKARMSSSSLEALIKRRMPEALTSQIPWVRKLAENLYES